MCETEFSRSSRVFVPLGLKFNPTDAELIGHYLERKINFQESFDFIEEMNVYDHEPWQLPYKNSSMFRPNEWWYFVKRVRASGKNTNGKRPRRTITGDINGGRWKATEGDKEIKNNDGKIIGFKKNLSFYTNKRNGELSKKEVKTDWIMTEYRLISDIFQDEVICKIRHNVKEKKNNKNKKELTSASHPSFSMKEKDDVSDINLTEILTNENFECAAPSLVVDVEATSAGGQVSNFSDFYCGVMDETVLVEESKEFDDIWDIISLEEFEMCGAVSDQSLPTDVSHVSLTTDDRIWASCCGDAEFFNMNDDLKKWFNCEFV